MPTLGERKKEIELLMQYAVPEVHLQEAAACVEIYAGDAMVLNILHNFYSQLPDAVDDGIKTLRLLARRQGTSLFCATTFLNDYLYIASPADVFFLGKLTDGIGDQEVLRFFGFADQQTFADRTRDLGGFGVHTPADRDKTLCPVCLVAAGEYHTLGCPVELCPWCGGQFTRCNCRFEQLDREQLDDEADVERLQEKLESAGRIPFDTEQRPGYPTFGDEEEDEDPVGIT